LYDRKNKKVILLYVAIIFLILSINSYNIYGLVKPNILKQNNTNPNITKPNINNNSTSTNQTAILTKLINSNSNNTSAILTKLINSNSNNTSGAISKPVGNITQFFGPSGQAIPMYLLSIVAMAMVIPLVIDMIMAYRRNSTKGSDNMKHQLVGMPGLYRTLMTFGIVLITGIVLLYLLFLIVYYNNNALIETLRNLSTILGTGLATIIAFYFGMRGSESAVEKAAKRLAPPGTIGDLSIPSIIKTKPSDRSEGVPINTNIYAKFSEPMDINSINKGTFTLVDSKNNVIDGKVSFAENNTKALFEPTKLEPATTYKATIESEVMDVGGNPMYKDNIWSFTTKGEEKLSIEEQSKMPKTGEKDVDPATTREISFKFNKEIDINTISTTTVKLLENDIASSPTHMVKRDEIDKSKVIIHPNKDLIPKTKYTIKVGPGVKDAKGNTLEKEEVWDFITKDIQPAQQQQQDTKPTILPQSKIPSAGQTDVDPATTREISFEFDKEMEASTINEKNIQLLENGKPLTPPHGVTLDKSDNKKVTIDPKKPLVPKTTYTIKVIKDVKDAKGNTLEKDEVWNFTTKGEEKQSADTKLAIEEQSKMPKTDEKDVDPKTTTKISFEFDKEMEGSTINEKNIQLLENGKPLTPPHGVTLDKSDNKKVTIDPKKPLVPKTVYTIKVIKDVKDTKGNTLEKDEVWNFTTKDIQSSQQQAEDQQQNKKLAIQPQSKIPSAGQPDVDPKTREISFKFNKDIDVNTITPANIQIVEGKIELILSPDSIKVDTSEKNKVLIELPKNLSLDTTYTIKVSRAVKDIDGNILDNAEEWSFTTKTK
jgi:hypothetical protein